MTKSCRYDWTFNNYVGLKYFSSQWKAPEVWKAHGEARLHRWLSEPRSLHAGTRLFTKRREVSPGEATLPSLTQKWAALKHRLTETLSKQKLDPPVTYLRLRPVSRGTSEKPAVSLGIRRMWIGKNGRWLHGRERDLKSPVTCGAVFPLVLSLFLRYVF